LSLTVRVIAPTGRDAELITTVLQQNGLSAEAISPSALLAAGDFTGIGPLLIAEEALTSALLQTMGRLLEAQPSWSDLPILVLTGNGRETAQSHRLQDERNLIGSPVLLERPIRTVTLVSSVKAALRARARQYEIRDVLAELKAERETLEVMLENLPVGVILAKPSGEIVTANHRVETLLRHSVLPSPDIESYGNWPTFRADGTRLRGEEFPLARAMKEGRPLVPEDFLYERGDGTKAWINVAASPVLNAEGVVTGGVVAISDIDLQKRSELALIQNEKLAAVGRLAASISHEINNPLEAVTNLVYLARESDGLPAQVSSYLESANQELGRVSQIVSHTLRFHRQSTSPRALTAEELLEPTLGLFAGRLANSNVELSVRHLGRRLVTCYEGEIRQVLNNLVGNAVESMRMGGRLSIRTADSERWSDGTSGVRISVADSGSGMSREVANKIFEAFYTTKGINGTGLGLWISRGIVEKHHGSLRFRTNDVSGKSGTVFSLFLPVEPFKRNR
jgi:signal transduction histidine kinase